MGWWLNPLFRYLWGDAKPFNGLEKFCSNNQMIVNETKTKMLCFGKQITSNVYFNIKLIETDDHYQYLGNVVRSVRTCNQDIFSRNLTYLCKQSRKALSIYVKRLNVLAPYHQRLCFICLMHWCALFWPTVAMFGDSICLALIFSTESSWIMPVYFPCKMYTL